MQIVIETPAGEKISAPVSFFGKSKRAQAQAATVSLIGDDGKEIFAKSALTVIGNAAGEGETKMRLEAQQTGAPASAPVPAVAAVASEPK